MLRREHCVQKSLASATPLPSSLLSFFEDFQLMSFWANMYQYLQHGSKPSEKGTHPLSTAAEVGCPDLVRCLLPLLDSSQEKDAEILSRSMMMAVTSGDAEIVDLFLAAKTELSSTLHAAASSGQHDLFKRSQFPEDGLDMRDSQELTQLHYACRSEVYEVVEELLELGADVNAKSSDDESEVTPLHMACMFGLAAIIKRLKRLDNVHLNAKDKSGRHLCIMPVSASSLMLSGRCYMARKDGRCPLRS